MAIQTEPVFIILPILFAGFLGIVTGQFVGLIVGTVFGVFLSLIVVVYELIERVEELERKADARQSE